MYYKSWITKDKICRNLSSFLDQIAWISALWSTEVAKKTLLKPLCKKKKNCFWSEILYKYFTPQLKCVYVDVRILLQTGCFNCTQTHLNYVCELEQENTTLFSCSLKKIVITCMSKDLLYFKNVDCILEYFLFKFKCKKYIWTIWF